jgi:hypothetical protein
MAWLELGRCHGFILSSGVNWIININASKKDRSIYRRAGTMLN